MRILRKLEPVAGELPESPDIWGGIKEALTMSKRKRMAIHFASRLSVFCLWTVCICVSRIKNGDPVFTCGFHTDVVAVLCEKPVAQGDDI